MFKHPYFHPSHRKDFVWNPLPQSPRRDIIPLYIHLSFKNAHPIPPQVVLQGWVRKFPGAANSGQVFSSTSFCGNSTPFMQIPDPYLRPVMFHCVGSTVNLEISCTPRMSRSLPTKSDKFHFTLSVFACLCMLQYLSMKALPSPRKEVDQANKLIAYLASIVMKSASSLLLIEYPWFRQAWSLDLRV